MDSGAHKLGLNPVSDTSYVGDDLEQITFLYLPQCPHG